jgi:hypothetical protein
VADQFDTGFSLIPGDDPLTPDEQLEAALSGLVPDVVEDVQRPYGRGWSFDFATGQFVTSGVSPAAAHGTAQLVCWIEKTLRTARFAHPIYSDNYGTELPFDAIGKQFTPALAGLMASRIEAALLVHDRISAVKDFTFDGGGTSHTLLVNFTVVTDEEELPLSQIPLGRF